MKLIVFLILFFLFFRNSYAQPSWLEDVLKDSSITVINEEASEIILFKTTTIEFNSRGYADILVRTVTKLLKINDERRDILLERSVPKRSIDNIRGWRILPNGNVEKLQDENITELSFSKIQAYYDEGKFIHGQFPYVHTGDIIAYEYEIEDKDWTSLHQHFVFQIQQPVAFAQFSVEIPKGWKLNESEWNLDSIHFKQQETKYIWTARNLPYQPEEPLMPPWSFLSRHLTIAVYNPADTTSLHFSNWNQVISWIQRLGEPPAVVNDSLKNFALEVIENLTTEEDKVRAIADYVKDKIRYVAVEIGRGRWEPHAASLTLQNKYGDCKDKATLLRALLQAIDIPSYLTLANTSFYINHDFPTPFQFNHAIVAIPVRGFMEKEQFKNALAHDWLFFDPTDEATPIGFLPPQLQGGTVLVATEADSVLVQLPYGRPESNLRTYRCDMTFTLDGSIKASAMIIDKGFYRHYLHYLFDNTSKEEQLRSLRKFLSFNFQNVTIPDYHTFADTDSVWTIFNFTVQQKPNSSGETILLKPNIFDMNDLPPLTNPTRVHPIWFGPPKVIEYDFNLELPSLWEPIDDFPDQTSACLDVAFLHYRIIPENGKLHFTSREQYSGWLVTKEDYEQAKLYSRAKRAISNLTLRLQSKVR